ncbi:MAG: oligosaccharide flippase family protein [Candidatus Gottesmanbacteria bacterium]|nr:oligosaccharide flippase family protein [Candidatus Gottesmanbacteria bacterium]
MAHKEFGIEVIKARSIAGVVALTSRTFILQIIAFVATIFLTIFLTPEVFGLFYVVSAIISFLGYFSDVGLAAALIQKKEKLTREDLVTTFTIQQILVGSAVIIALAGSTTIGGWYGLDDSGIWLLRVLAIAFFISSLKTIPSILLERELAFSTLIIPQILETIGFYSTAIFLAWLGFGVTSFTWAVAVRAIVGFVAMYIVAPWKPGFGISREVAKHLMRYGIPFQLNSFLALIKDDLLTVFLGRALPLSHIGYIGWAKKWAEVPLRLIMDSVIRVTFPAFSRLQHDKERLRLAIEKTLFGLSVTIFPITIAMIIAIKPLIAIIPRYGKWEPAVFSFYLFAVASAIASLSTPLTNALNALGFIKTTLKLMILWTLLTWVLTVSLLPILGFNGVAFSLLLITSTLILVVILTQRAVPFSFLTCVQIPFIGSIGQVMLSFGIIMFFGSSLPNTIVAVITGGILFGGIVWVFEREKLRALTSNLSTLWKR